MLCQDMNIHTGSEPNFALAMRTSLQPSIVAYKQYIQSVRATLLLEQANCAAGEGQVLC